MVAATVEIVLTEEQQQAVDAALEFLDDGDELLFRIGGYAGTGKTTIAKEIVNRSKKHAAVCAFTGKACSVLRRKGMPYARTIHSTIYEWSNAAQKFILCRHTPADYFLVDEGSMVSHQLWDDLCSFGKPIIVIGDPGQLEPVGDDPRLMENPDIVLEQIHRQAENSMIIEFANKVRHGHPFRHGHKGEVGIYRKSAFWHSLEWADHVLCGFNRTRVEANRLIRQINGMTGNVDEGERIICLRNDRDLGVWNGQMLTINEIRDQPNRWSIIADCTTDDGEDMPGLPIYLGQFGSEKQLSFEKARTIREMAIADYGYCTTVHKFQGSEADRVLVMDEQCQVWDEIRWRYTAITRAAKELRYCV